MGDSVPFRAVRARVLFHLSFNESKAGEFRGGESVLSRPSLAPAIAPATATPDYAVAVRRCRDHDLGFLLALE